MDLGLVIQKVNGYLTYLPKKDSYVLPLNSRNPNTNGLVWAMKYNNF